MLSPCGLTGLIDSVDLLAERPASVVVRATQTRAVWSADNDLLPALAKMALFLPARPKDSEEQYMQKCNGHRDG